MRGISTRMTSIGWHVIRLHYSADEAKDPATPEGRKWLKESKTGMSDARWRKEFEIDYGAMGGQLVFPEFDESVHVVETLPPLYPEFWTVWLACDPHPRTPHAFVWLAVNREGEMIVPWSYWPQNLGDTGPRLTVKDYAKKLTLIHNSGLRLKPYKKLMDVAAKSMDASEERTYFDAYREAGIHFLAAKKNRGYTGYELIREALKPTSYMVGNKETFRPRLTIVRDCGHNDELIFQIKNLRFREWRGNVTDKDAPEDPEQKRRHLIDGLSYILLDKPRFIDRSNRHVEQDYWHVVNAAPGN